MNVLKFLRARECFFESVLVAFAFAAYSGAAAAAPGAAVFIVDGGKPSAVVVTADNPAATALYAAGEFVEHVKAVSGVELLIAEESNIPAGYKSRIFVGATEAAGKKGIESESLGVDEAVLLTSGSDLYVVGNKAPHEADPLDVYTRPSGTLFGIYEIIERCLGVVWAWPGELGRYAPSSDRLVIKEPLDETYSPHLAMRRVGGRYTTNIARGLAGYDPNVERISFSRKGLENYSHAAKTFLRRHRSGRGEGVPSTGHFFVGWWSRYGEEHPEWFMMNEEGDRGKAEGMRPEHVAMCVSNPELQSYVARLHRNAPNIRLGEVDSPDFCRCPDCEAWDGPQYPEEELPDFLKAGPYSPRVVSDRYARFWKAVHNLAAERNPGVTVTSYLYFNYFPAPEEVDEIDPGIWGFFVPWKGQETVFFPMSEDALQWKKEQWKGWADTGMSMVYRPNYLHDGYAMPYMDTRQSGEFFKHAYANGMVGAHFDTLCGQWAVQGPKLYLHLRLLAKPYLEIEDVLDEYYSVFGPAEEHVREYFGYWEDYALKHHERINELYRQVGSGRWRRFHHRAHEAFPEESFLPAEKILRKALEAAGRDVNPEYGERVEFLKAGLEHAKLAGRLAAVFDGEFEISPGTERFREARQALENLVRFRRAREDMFIFDFAYLASKELRRDSWNLNRLFK